MKMDDIFGILFYLLLIVIGGLISAYRNKNKRKMMTPPQSIPQEDPVINETPASGYDPFEEFTKKFGLDINEPVESPEAEPELTLQSGVDSPEKETDTPIEEGMAVFEDTREIMQSDSEPDKEFITHSQISDMKAGDETQSQSNLNLAGNIKQAIIYSEILKRKHF
jgi:hypothetical protein